MNFPVHTVTQLALQTEYSLDLGDVLGETTVRLDHTTTRLNDRLVNEAGAICSVVCINGATQIVVVLRHTFVTDRARTIIVEAVVERVTTGVRQRSKLLGRLTEVTANTNAERYRFGQFKVRFHEQVGTLVRRLDVVNRRVVVRSSSTGSHQTNFVRL